ncbi:hypothetical protein VPH35_005936 [Triticum aestivum]
MGPHVCSISFLKILGILGIQGCVFDGADPPSLPTLAAQPHHQRPRGPRRTAPPPWQSRAPRVSNMHNNISQKGRAATAVQGSHAGYAVFSLWCMCASSSLEHSVQEQLAARAFSLWFMCA